MLTLTDEHRQKILKQFAEGCVDAKQSLCCGPRELAVAIVGEDYADGLSEWAHESLGCDMNGDAWGSARKLFRERIANLKTLGKNEDN